MLMKEVTLDHRNSASEKPYEGTLSGKGSDH